MIRYYTDDHFISPGSEPGNFVTESSDLQWVPGYFPMTIQLDGEVLERVGLDETCAGYKGPTLILTVFND